jgi:outer membrane protein TolC
MQSSVINPAKPVFCLTLILPLTIGGSLAQTVPVRSYVQAGNADAQAFAEGPEIPLTLPQAVYLGLRQNPGVRSAYLQRVLDQFNLRVSESLFSLKGSLVTSLNADRTAGTTSSDARLTPTVQLLTPLGTAINFGWEARQTASLATGGDLLSGSQSGKSSLTLSVIQPLLKGGGLEANMVPVRQARLQEHYNRLRLKTTVTDTVTDIVRAYHQFIQAGQQITLARTALKRARDLEVTNQALIRAGRMAAVELVQAQATVVNQELALLNTESAFDAARLRLLSLLALDLHSSIVPGDTLTAEPIRVDAEKARTLAFDNRPDYLSQLIVIEAGRLGLTLAKNQRLWDLALTAGVNVPGDGRTGRRATGNLPQTKTDLRTGLQLTVPLNDLSIEQREVQATIDLRQSEVLLEQVRMTVEQQVRDGIRAVDASWRQYKLSQQASSLAAKTLEAETTKLRAGRSSNFQVVTFQDQLRFAENAALTALVGYLDALVTLDQQLGTTIDTWQIQLNEPAQR